MGQRLVLGSALRLRCHDLIRWGYGLPLALSAYLREDFPRGIGRVSSPSVRPVVMLPVPNQTDSNDRSTYTLNLNERILTSSSLHGPSISLSGGMETGTN